MQDYTVIVIYMDEEKDVSLNAPQEGSFTQGPAPEESAAEVAPAPQAEPAADDEQGMAAPEGVESEAA